MRNITIIILAFTGLSSCEKDTIHDSEFAQELRSSPESISIGNNSLVLITELWRDFMPISEENGRKMTCLNQLFDVDSISISNTLLLEKQYVINGNEVWTADYDRINNNIDFILEGVVINGPKWGPNIEVDVVCEFKNSGTTYRILAKSQLIKKTE